jgi:crotonobetainyl-CoA:carnitine CoA-transferase CaiB-like acyl-CoA transferase
LRQVEDPNPFKHGITLRGLTAPSPSEIGPTLDVPVLRAFLFGHQERDAADVFLASALTGNTVAMAGPLEGIKVVDLTQVVAGPVCTMLLAEQGAEIIKVEFLEGDILRQNSLFSKNGMNALELNCNRGKKSIAVDMNTPEGLEIVKALAADADVFVQNFRAGAVERLGINHEELREVNPKLITVWMSGFGQTGPMADVPVFDPVIQAVSGHCAVQVNPNVPFPDVHRTILIDKSTALTTAQAITAALFARERSDDGVGQHLEVSMLDTALFFFWPDGGMAHTLLDDDVSGGWTLYQVMSVTACSDGHLVYYLQGDSNFQGLLRAIDRHDMADDPRYGTSAGRAGSGDVMAEIATAVEAGFYSLERDEALERLRHYDVPSAPMLQVDEIHEFPQVIHNETMHEWDHPTAGRVRQPRSAAKFSGTQIDPRWWVPGLGENTDEILASIGHDADAVAALRSAGTVT